VTPGYLRRGWVFTFGSALIRHRLRFDHDGTPGSAHRLPAGHPPWLISGVPNRLGTSRRWFQTAEEALVWVQGEIDLKTTRDLL